MRFIFTILTVLALTVCAFGAEINLGLDRCVILNNADDSLAPSKIALYFAYPDSLTGKEIVYAEMHGSLSIHHNGPDSLFELRFYPLLADWPDRAYDYQSIEAITDSMSAGIYTIRLGDSSAFFVDVTEYVMQLACREHSNYGLIATADLLGETNIKLTEAVGERLRSTLRVRVIYK